MLKRTITYPDFEGEMRTDDFYFNLNKAEIIEFEASTKDGLTKVLRRAMTNEDQSIIIPVVKEIILRSVGEKSLDGKRFVKNDEIRESFYQTEAYSQLFIELLQDPEKAQAFVVGIMPSSMAPSMQKALAEQNAPS